MKVDQLKFYEVIDSRGNPTIACKIFSGKFSSISMVPSGASTGSKEAQEIRDNDKKRFLGKAFLPFLAQVLYHFCRHPNHKKC